MGYGIKKLQIGCVVEDDKVKTPERLLHNPRKCVFQQSGLIAYELNLCFICGTCVLGGHRHPGGADHSF